MTKYTIVLASRGAVHCIIMVLVVLKLWFLQKIHIFFQRFYSHNSEVYTLDHVYTLRIDAVAVDRLCVPTALMLSVAQIGAISLHSKKWSVAISE